jgi:hypothetical protein
VYVIHLTEFPCFEKLVDFSREGFTGFGAFSPWPGAADFESAAGRRLA